MGGEYPLEQTGRVPHPPTVDGRQVPAADPPTEAPEEEVGHPGRVVRLATMTQALLRQVEELELDDAARHRLALVFNRTVESLRELLSDEMRQEVDRLELRLPADPTSAELRVAQAQLVGWLEGLFHGIRTAMLVQEQASRAELSEAHRRGLEAASREQERRGPGQYL